MTLEEIACKLLKLAFILFSFEIYSNICDYLVRDITRNEISFKKRVIVFFFSFFFLFEFVPWKRLFLLE